MTLESRAQRTRDLVPHSPAFLQPHVRTRISITRPVRTVRQRGLPQRAPTRPPIAWPAHSELATWFYTRLRSSGLMCACVFRSRSPSAPCDYTASNRMARTHRTRGPAPLVQKLQLCGFGMRVLFDYAAFSVQFAALLNFLRLPHPHVYRITEVFIREAFLSVKPELTYTR